MIKMNKRTEELFNKYYFERSSYGKQEAKIIERNYKYLLKEGLKYFSEILNKEGLKILDFGCAYGIGTYYLSRVFKNSIIVGVDISDYAIKRAKILYQKVKNLYFHNLDLSQERSVKFLIEKYGHFDVIFTRDVLEHIPKEQQETVVKNFSIILKRGGIVFASIANGLNLYSYVCDKTHIGLRPPWFWKKIFNKYMKVIKCYEKQWIPFLWRFRRSRKMIEIHLPLFGFVIYLFAKN